MTVSLLLEILKVIIVIKVVPAHRLPLILLLSLQHRSRDSVSGPDKTTALCCKALGCRRMNPCDQIEHSILSAVTPHLDK